MFNILTWSLSLWVSPIWENVEHQRHYTWCLFSSWQNWPLGKELPMTWPLTKCMVSGLYKQDIRKKECQTLIRQGKMVLKSFLPIKMACQLIQTFAKVGCSNIANESLGDCPGNWLCLSFTAYFGSCLIAYSSHMISLLRSSMWLKTR